MPTFSNIDGEESATVTFTVAAVSLSRNSSAELQEILCIGDPEVASSLGLARVSNTPPASTNAGLNVRVLSGPSSVADFSVRPIAPSTYGDGGLYRVAQSTAGDLNVTVAGYVAPTTGPFVISSVVGPVNVRSSAANLLASVYQSTAADLNVTVAGYVAPTTGPFVISSVVGPVNVRSSAANLLASVYQSTAADLNVTVAGYSTIAAVSSVGGIVAVAPASSGATGFYAVRLSDGSTFVTDSTDRSIRVSVVAGSAAGDTTVTVMPGSSASTRWFPVQIGDGSTWISDSTNRAIRVNVVAGSVAGDTTATVTQASTVWPVQLPTSQSFQVKNSTIGDLLASVQQNSTTWAVQMTQYSTTMQVSSVGGAVIMRSSAADALGTVYQSTFADLRATVHNSTIGDLLASVQQNSTVWQVQAKIQDSSGVGPNIVGTRPSTGAQGIAVRSILNDLQSTCFSTQGNNSTSNTVVSSVANQRVKVFAYSVTSTVQAVNTLSFASSLANPIWQIQMQSVSSGISGANLAVSPPAWLFATAVNEPLVFKVTGTTGSYHLSFSYFIEA